MSRPVYCRAWSTNDQEKQDCLPESDLQGRVDGQRSPCFHSICKCSKRQNIRENNRCHKRHGYQKNFVQQPGGCHPQQIDLGNHQWADQLQKNQQEAESVFEADSLSINRQTPTCSCQIRTQCGGNKGAQKKLS